MSGIPVVRAEDLRPMTERDRSFVVPTWVFSCDYSDAMLSRIGYDRSFKSRFKLVDRLVNGCARVTCFATDVRTVHAWCAHAGEVLLYAYVAPELRRHGLAKRLVAEIFPNGPRRIAHKKPQGFPPLPAYRPLALIDALAMEHAA